MYVFDVKCQSVTVSLSKRQRENRHGSFREKIPTKDV